MQMLLIHVENQLCGLDIIFFIVSYAEGLFPDRINCC